MEPLYGIPAAIRYGVMALEEWEEQETIAIIINEVKSLLNEHAAKLNGEAIIEVVSYVDHLQDLLGSVLESYVKMGYNLPKESIKEYAKKGIFLIDGIDLENIEKEEKDKKQEPVVASPEEKFMLHVTADIKGKIYATVINIHLQQYILRLAKDELVKYLPENRGNSEEKTLNRSHRDID